MKGIFFNGILTGIQFNSNFNGKILNGTLNGIRCNGIFNGIRENGIFNGIQFNGILNSISQIFPQWSLLSALFRIRETTKQINGMRYYDLYRSRVNICVC